MSINSPGGHYFEYADGAMHIEPYYQIRYQIDESKTLEQWEDLITEEFSGSVLAHKIADVEVGCFLSSGVDSSYVAKEVSKTADGIKTFSVGYEEEKYSELPYAQGFQPGRRPAEYQQQSQRRRFFGAARLVQYYMDEPMPNPSEIPLIFLAKNAARYVKVVLSGEGADELFGGYPIPWPACTLTVMHTGCPVPSARPSAP